MIYKNAICMKCGHRWVTKSTNPRCPVRSCRSPMVNFEDNDASTDTRLYENPIEQHKTDYQGKNCTDSPSNAAINGGTSPQRTNVENHAEGCLKGRANGEQTEYGRPEAQEEPMGGYESKALTPTIVLFALLAAAAMVMRGA